MWLLIFIILGAFISALVWLIRNWSATGPTDPWGDDDIVHRPVFRTVHPEPARPDPHASVPLTAIGFWSTEDEPDWPKLRAFQDPGWAPDERELVRSHLEHGMPVAWDTVGGSTCALCARSFAVAELTDGTYAWPGYLAHQVGEHDVRLPGLFVLHVRTTADVAMDPLGLSADRESMDAEWWRMLPDP